MNVTYHTVPTSVCSTSSIAVTHHIIALSIHHDFAAVLSSSRWDNSHTLKWYVLPQRILDVLARCGTKRFLIALLESFNRVVRTLAHVVPASQCSVVWSLVVIKAAHSIVKGVDQICTWDVMLLQMRSTVCNLDFPPNDIQWTVAHVAWEALAEGGCSPPVCAGTCIGLVLADDRWV